MYVCVYNFICWQCKKSTLEEVEIPPWQDREAHEEEPAGREAGIKIDHLTKTYTPVSFSYVCSSSLSLRTVAQCVT